MWAGLVATVQSLGPIHYWVFTGIAAAATVSGFHSAFYFLVRARVLEDTPTSRVRSAPQGYVEMQGTAIELDGPPIVAPLTGTRCIWWHYTIEERSSNRRRSWRVVSEDSSTELFSLEDDSGTCIIDPEGADVFTLVSQRWYGDNREPAGAGRRHSLGGRFRFTERRIHHGDPLYAIGQHTTRHMHDGWDLASETAQLLRGWKKDQHRLLNRFDHNRDGRIDLDEWQRARVAARREVERQHLQQQSHPGLNILSVPPGGRPYLLGALPQPSLAKKLRRKALAGLAAFAFGGACLALLISIRFGL